MVIDVRPTATRHKSESHDNIIVHHVHAEPSVVSGRKNEKEKQPMNCTDGVGAREGE